jgi:hypothetical protein
MPRIDVAIAQEIEADLSEKIRSQTATPGSEAALRRMIAWHTSGNPDYTQMSPELAKLVEQQLPRTTVLFKELGALKSAEFKGVGNQGWDIQASCRRASRAPGRFERGPPPARRRPPRKSVLRHPC